MFSNMPENVNVLLVEDDEIDVEAVKREFKKRNIKNPLYHATCGVDALEMLRGENQKQKLPRPFVMLVDINMPKMNGLDFLREVRNDNNLKESIAFILTTSARDVDVEAAYKLNAAGYFLKDNVNDLVDILSVYRQINKFPDRTGGTATSH
jgi:CheY-like chemotaxis protein